MARQRAKFSSEWENLNSFEVSPVKKENPPAEKRMDRLCVFLLFPVSCIVVGTLDITEFKSRVLLKFCLSLNKVYKFLMVKVIKV